MERDGDHFDIDDEFVASSEDETDYDRMMEPRRTRVVNTPAKKGKAAWSKLEDVLAEKRLLKQLKDFDEDA